LEALCASVQGVNDISSTSNNGGGQISISIDKKADVDAIRFEISTLIRQAWSNLPAGVTYPQIIVNRADDKEETPLLTYTLNASASAYVIQKYAEEVIRPALTKISGIYKTQVFGASPMEWRIIYDADRMNSLGVTPNDIQAAINLGLKKESIGNAHMNRNGKGNDSVTNIKSSEDAFAPNDLTIEGETYPLVISTGSNQNLETTPVKQINGRIIYLHDIAKVIHREAEPQSYFRINGQSTINILIFAASGENNLALSRRVKEKLEKLSASFPAGYKLLQGYDSTEYIRNELKNIGIRTIFTFLILLLFVFVVTRKLKHVLMVLVMLVVNLSIASIFYYFLKIEIHLYALAGITVSMGLMTDNIIIMSDHLRTRGNRLAWLAIFAGTLCTISALTIIFFLEEEVKANLVDFAYVIIVNQSVSLLTALFLIPALMDVLRLDKRYIKNKTENRNWKIPWRRKKVIGSLGHRGGWVVVFTRFYQRFYLRLRKRKFIPITIFVLGFGLPVFLLPDKWEGENWYNKTYDSTIGSNTYKESIRPWMNKVLGGTFRLFAENVYEGSYFKNSEETTLYITANMPNGTTLEQMNVQVGTMEKYLQQFKEIKTFQSNISTNRASINVYFKKEHQNTGFPYTLKGQVISKALELGGGSWGVFGFGDGFSNNINEGTGSYFIQTLGYNYDQLYGLAEKLKEKLKQNPRVKEVYIVPKRTWYKPDNAEFVVSMNSKKSIVSGISPVDLYSELQKQAQGNIPFATTLASGVAEDIKLYSDQSREIDVWQLERIPLKKDSIDYKFNNFSKIDKEFASPSVIKINQQYQLCLQFEYIGVYKFGEKFVKKTLAEFAPQFPLGYSATFNSGYWFWGEHGKNQYWLLGLIVAMIFFICAILFESLLQPFAVILTIPIAYIGVFLTFYLFDLNFDQGGFAAFVMLSGITVNAAIYILNDYNSLRRHHIGRKVPNIKMYFRAFSYKIVPILLTIVATVLGFVPFLIGEKQPFWFSLAAGTIGGLVFSLIGIIFYLPLFLRIKEK
ncbi:MAG: efflux RND transporter permease subunit, partial [Bacteroidales bacterium]